MTLTELEIMHPSMVFIPNDLATLIIRGGPEMFQTVDQKELSLDLAVSTIVLAINLLKRFRQIRMVNVQEVAIAQHVIPNRKVLDKLLRYETTIDRSLNRALDRLERLQRRRKAELVLPPVSVHLIQ